MISRWVVGVALLFGILLMMLPKRDEASLARIASQAMLMCTKDFRERVAQKVIGKEAVAVEFKNKCPDLVASLEMDERGEMVITGNRHQLKMRLTPIVGGGKVRWSCRGEPAAVVTKPKPYPSASELPSCSGDHNRNSE
jgi:hypothetical protein